MKKDAAFTIIELIIVIAILIVIGYLIIPLGMNFYYTQQLDSVSDEIISALRKARQKSIAAELDSTFGLRLSQNQYTVFASSDPSYDENFKIPDAVNPSGISEVVFSKITGYPSVAGYIILRNQDKITAININEVGLISLKHPVLQSIVLRPNAVGSESSLRINGCAENWQCVDEEISDDDTSYVYAMRSESSNDLYSLPDPGIDAASTIIQLRLYFNCRRNDIASKTVAGYLRTNSQSDQRPDKPLTDTYQIFSEVYPVNPVTANAWTSAEIDDLEIGINLTSTGGVPNEARCSQVWAEVEYLSF